MATVPVIVFTKAKDTDSGCWYILASTGNRILYSRRFTTKYERDVAFERIVDEA